MHIRNPPFSVSPGPDVYSLSFNEDGQFLAASYSDSEVRVFSVAKGTVAYRFQINAKRAPATMIRFRFMCGVWVWVAIRLCHRFGALPPNKINLPNETPVH